MIRIQNLTFTPGADSRAALLRAAAKALRLAPDKITFFLQRSAKARGTDLQNVGIVDEIVPIQQIAQLPVDYLAVIHCDSARLIDVSPQIPVAGFFYILHIHQLEAVGFHDGYEKLLCLLFVLFSLCHSLPFPGRSCFLFQKQRVNFRSLFVGRAIHSLTM